MSPLSEPNTDFILFCNVLILFRYCGHSLFKPGSSTRSLGTWGMFAVFLLFRGLHVSGQRFSMFFPRSAGVTHTQQAHVGSHGSSVLITTGTTVALSFQIFSIASFNSWVLFSRFSHSFFLMLLAVGIAMFATTFYF